MDPFDCPSAEVMVEQQSSHSFTLEIDKRILAGFLGDQEVMLRELADAGFDRKAVLDRALSLGLSRDFVAQCQVGEVRAAMRECLSCQQRFASLGPQNRLCRRCRSRK